MSNKPTRGGARKGAGRPSKSGETVVVSCRVPIEIKEFLTQYNGTESELIIKALREYYKI